MGNKCCAPSNQDYVAEIAEAPRKKKKSKKNKKKEPTSGDKEKQFDTQSDRLRSEFNESTESKQKFVLQKSTQDQITSPQTAPLSRKGKKGQMKTDLSGLSSRLNKLTDQHTISDTGTGSNLDNDTMEKSSGNRYSHRELFNLRNSIGVKKFEYTERSSEQLKQRPQTQDKEDEEYRHQTMPSGKQKELEKSAIMEDKYLLPGDSNVLEIQVLNSEDANISLQNNKPNEEISDFTKTPRNMPALKNPSPGFEMIRKKIQMRTDNSPLKMMKIQVLDAQETPLKDESSQGSIFETPRNQNTPFFIKQINTGSPGHSRVVQSQDFIASNNLPNQGLEYQVEEEEKMPESETDLIIEDILPQTETE